MHLREVELGTISVVEIDRDQAELGAASSQAELSQSDSEILVIGYSRYFSKNFQQQQIEVYRL